MDEYFCPKCGAILNYQTGFSPNCGAWTCTECGQMLMDENVYNGDEYEGVAWFCDACGVLLNKQAGFSDSYGSWTCTECGYNNSTTEDEIIDNDDGLKCPSCGTMLSKQFGFCGYEYDWECTECGADLHRDYSFSEFYIEKDDDATYKIGKTIGQGLAGVISGVFSSAINPNKNDLKNNNEDETYEENENQEYNDEVSYGVQNENIENSQKDKKRDVITFCICFVSMILVFIFSYYMAFVPKKGETKITINSKDYIGVNYKEVEEKFKEMGFTDIRCVPKEDLIFGWINNEGETKEICINRDNKFDKGDIFSKDAEVVITYHSFKN